MKEPDIVFYAYYRPGFAEGIEPHYSRFMKVMGGIGPPLGFAGLELPPVPKFRRGHLLCTYGVKPAKNVKCFGVYKFRTESFGNDDRASEDDNVCWGLFGKIDPQAY